MNKKKAYEVPQMKVHQVKAESIICTSGGTPPMSLFENATHEEGGITGGNGGDGL